MNAPVGIAEPSIASCPSWLLVDNPPVDNPSVDEPIPRSAPGSGRRRWRRTPGGFLSSTLVGAAALLRHTVFSAEIAARPGLAQGVDARVKLGTTVGLLITVGLVRSLPVLLACYAATVILATSSNVPFRAFISRVWLFVPIFTGIIVLPATLSFVTPGTIILPLGHWDGALVGVTAQGLYGAGLIVARVATSVSLVLLLTLTTPWAQLLAALHSLGVPAVFVLTIGLTYRYIFLLLDGVQEMYTARQARPHSAKGRAGRQLATATMGVLFGKTYLLSTEVHQAMVARGFAGRALILDQPRLRTLDLSWGGLALLASAVILIVDNLLGN